MGAAIDVARCHPVALGHRLVELRQPVRVEVEVEAEAEATARAAT